MIEAYRVQEGLESSIAGGQVTTETRTDSPVSESPTPAESQSTSQSATVTDVTNPLSQPTTPNASPIEASAPVSEPSVLSATAIVATSTPANASPPVRNLWPNSLASRPSPQFVFHDMNGNIPLQPRTVLLQDIIDGLDHYDSQAVLIEWTNQHFVPYPAYCTLPPDVLRALQEAGMTDTWLIGQVFQRDPVTGEADEDFPPTEPVYPTTSEEAEAFRTSQPPVLKLDELTDQIVQYNPQARILENHNGRYHVHEPGSQFPTSTAFELFENNIFDRWVYNRSHCIYPPEPTSPPSPPPASPETTTTTDSPTIIPTVRVEEVSTTFNQADAPPPSPPSSEETPVIRYSLYRQQNSLLVTEPARSDDTSDSFPSAPSN